MIVCLREEWTTFKKEGLQTDINLDLVRSTNFVYLCLWNMIMYVKIRTSFNTCSNRAGYANLISVLMWLQVTKSTEYDAYVHNDTTKTKL